MLKILSYFVIKNQTPHIILPICTFYSHIKPFIKIDKSIIKHKRYEQFIENYKKHQYYEHVSILISEWADGGDLLDYFRKNYKSMSLIQWKIIFFQILSVLAVIQNKYPSFRHNDLKANNILIQEIEKKHKYRYKINNQIYIIPSTGIMLKIWDFDFACIPNLVENKKVRSKWTNKLNICPEKNMYYDMHYFFNTLIKKSFLPELMTSSKIPIQVKEFIRRVVPLELSEGKDVTDRGRLLVKIEYTTPDFILKNDNFFEEFRVCD